MNLPSLRLRAIGPPLVVAAVCVAGLAWFDRIWIPAQQQYVNERNLRALRTISAQIKAKVDNFDQAIDHAIDSFPNSKDNLELLQKYVKLFSPELEIVAFDPPPGSAKVTPGDPPNVRIQRDEGRNYLYLGYRHENGHRKGRAAVTLIARGDIDQVTAPSLARKDFDALLLLDGHGATIAQQSSSGLEMTSIDRVVARGQSSGAGSTSVFDRMRGTTSLAVVTIGAADYMLYTQPVQLSLVHDAKDGTQAPEEWTLCGMVRLDRFRAASSTIPTTYWLCFGTILALICFSIPVLKLQVLSPRERLTRLDGVSIAAAIFLLMALATFAALDLRTFGSEVPEAVDAQLRGVAESMTAHVRLEAGAIARQMDVFGRDDVWRQQLKYEQDGQRGLTEIREQLQANQGADINLSPGAGGGWQCEPSWSCRTGVLRQLGDIEYPFFRMMVWTDDAGWQRIKWSTSSVVTPFVNVSDAKLAYFDSLKLARRLSLTAQEVPDDGVAVVTSPNTGEKLTVFWRALPPLKDTLPKQQPDLTGATLATMPVSLTNPILPKHVQFAVVDRLGRVLFHSDPSRILAENMFQESEDDPALKSLVASRESGAISARYLGRAHRLFVTPIDVRPFGDPRWSLVTFQPAAVSETANLETANLAISMFIVYALGLAAIWAVLGRFWPDSLRAMLWPAPARALKYRRAAVVGIVAVVVCMAARAVATPATVVPATAALILGGVMWMGIIVHAGPDAHRPSSVWPVDFFCARASLLFLLAAVPAALCFEVAYAFHANLIVRRGDAHLASELGARARRINQDAQRVALCTDADAGSQPCSKIGTLIDRRTNATLWDVDVPAIPEPRVKTAGGSDFASTALGSFLKAAYRPYNEIAADLLMTSASRQQALGRWQLTVDAHGGQTFARSGDSSRWRFVPAIAPKPRLDALSWLIAAVLMSVAYALVRYLLEPIFTLDLKPAARLLAASGASEDTCLLVLGPPGARRTERLERHPRVRIFDVRSLSFGDDPMAATIVDEHASAADCGHAGQPASEWTETIHQAAARPLTIVAFDHLEHRLDDAAFRGTMLECLESLIYHHHVVVWCSAVRDPIERLQEIDAPEQERCRWAGVFEGFRREHLGLEVDGSRSRALVSRLSRYPDIAADAKSLIVSECEVTPELLAVAENLLDRVPLNTPLSGEDALAEIERGARPFYDHLWRACALDERVALRQLAEEGLINPNNRAAIARLLDAGLVHRHQTFQIVNETFRRFVIGAASPAVISGWEREGVRVPWGTIATTGVTVAFGLAGLLLLTQEQLVDAWISYVPALAPAIPTVWKVLASAQKGRVEAVA